MNNLRRRILETLICSILVLLFSFSAVGHSEDGVMFIFDIMLLSLTALIFSIRQRDLLFRMIIYPVSLALGWILFVFSMAERYGGLKDSTNASVWLSPRVLIFAGLTAFGVLAIDRIARLIQER